MAQPRASEPLRPRWIQKAPRPTNSTFAYEMLSATASSLDAAREKCLAELVVHSGLRSGVVAISDNRSEEHLSQVWTDGRLSEQIVYDSRTFTRLQGSAVQLHVENIAEYWVRDRSGNYYLTKLFAKSELGRMPLFDRVESTTRYGARGLWRSAVIPGWGQFHKGANLKGGLILGGCAIVAAGIVFTENQRSDYVRRIGQTRDIDLLRSYRTKRDHFATARNICIGAAAALYLYNLIDAVAAPGARRLVVHRRPSGDRTYAFAPTLFPDGAAGIATSVNF
ncbi:MAG: DUF5683 domain-containing protein [Alistipes sp.]|nr:DUF5683 domain-containing protein [Alistipes senegalensis]MCM1250832.1 DUF5683 domain-containing protein [Alistipes sp.]